MVLKGSIRDSLKVMIYKSVLYGCAKGDESMHQNAVRIPRVEYPGRWAKVQKIMKDNRLDVILAYSDDRATHGNA